MTVLESAQQIRPRLWNCGTISYDSFSSLRRSYPPQAAPGE